MANFKSDKSMFGIPGLLYRDLLELDIGQHDIKNRKNLLWSIHCWICALNPIEEKQPDNCKESLDELRDMNETGINDLAYVEEQIDGSPVSPEDLSEVIVFLGGVEARIKQIVARAKLIDAVNPTTGVEAP